MLMIQQRTLLNTNKTDKLDGRSFTPFSTSLCGKGIVKQEPFQGILCDIKKKSDSHKNVMDKQADGQTEWRSESPCFSLHIDNKFWQKCQKKKNQQQN